MKKYIVDKSIFVFAGFILLICLQTAFPYDKKSLTPDTLTLSQLHKLDSLEKATRIMPCCGSDLSTCLHVKPSCTLAQHMHVFLKWLIARNSPDSVITAESAKRIDNLCATQKQKIDTSVFPVVGDPHAPVLIVGYVNARCPFCHYVSRELYAAVTTGVLAHKARFTVKPYGFGAANCSMVAAQRMGRFWDYWLAVCRVEARFDPPIMMRIADSLGMKNDRLTKLIEDPATAAVVDSCMAEGIKNGVTIAPTFFINHIRYKSYKDPQWLIDAAVYKYEETVPSR